MKTGVIIVAGGSGTRMGGSVPKQFRIVGGMPLLARTINTFAETLPTASIVVVLPAEYIGFWNNLTARFSVARHKCVAGGAERFHSVKAGLAALPENTEYAAVHDGVRALCSKRVIVRTLECAMENGSAVPAIKPVDSFRMVTDSGTQIVNRDMLRIIQTPQIFRFAELKLAYETDYDPAFTDDASVAEKAGIEIHLCEGERNNIKITTPEDIATAETILSTDNEDLSI